MVEGESCRGRSQDGVRNVGGEKNQEKNMRDKHRKGNKRKTEEGGGGKNKRGRDKKEGEEKGEETEMEE